MIAQIGDRWSKDGEKQKVWLLTGAAYKNGVINYIGKDKTPVGQVLVDAGKTMNGKRLFVTVQFWEGRVGLAMKVKRFDRVLAIGTLRKMQNKTTGTIYYSINSSFFQREDKPKKYYTNTPKTFDLEDYRGDLKDDPF